LEAIAHYLWQKMSKMGKMKECFSGSFEKRKDSTQGREENNPEKCLLQMEDMNDD